MRAAITFALVVALTGIAGAQPGWSPNAGWDTDFEAQRRAWHDQFEARRREMHRQFEEDTKRMDEELDQSRTQTIVVFGIFAGAILLFGALGAAATRRRRAFAPVPEIEPLAALPAPIIDGVDISVLRIAIDGRASKFVRTELERIMSSFEGSPAEVRSKRLREISVTLRRVRDSWIYGGAVNDPIRSRSDARAALLRHVDDARVRFTREAVPEGPPGLQDQTLILVSIIVAARGELASVSEIGAGEELRRALEAAVHRDPNDLVALEVVWIPEEDGRVLTQAQLEAHYPPPDLYRLRGAVVGKVFCTYCAGPFPAELVSCPHCGAPAPGRRADRD